MKAVLRLVKWCPIGMPADPGLTGTRLNRSFDAADVLCRDDSRGVVIQAVHAAVESSQNSMGEFAESALSVSTASLVSRFLLYERT
jgi:hypothetical protein